MTSNFRTLDSADLAGKRVLVRVDLNVPMENGKVTDITRIERVAPTIREIADKGGKVILLAHFGRPKGRDPKESLKPVAAAVAHVSAARSPSPTTASARPPSRPSPRCRTATSCAWKTRASTRKRKRTTRGSSQKLAKLGDIYVNDAFSAAHRAHASTEGLARKLPAYAGRAMQAELEALGKALEAPKRPVIAIVGGAKVSTKLELLGEPDRQGRRAGDRRRHGEHVPVRARHQGRQVARREGHGRHRAAHPRQGRGRKLRDHPAGGRDRGVPLPGQRAGAAATASTRFPATG